MTLAAFVLTHKTRFLMHLTPAWPRGAEPHSPTDELLSCPTRDARSGND